MIEVFFFRANKHFENSYSIKEMVGVVHLLVLLALPPLTTATCPSFYNPECCRGQFVDEVCVCWSNQYFGTKCDYICRDDLCNNRGICGNESNPIVVQGVFRGTCICDDPQDTRIHCGDEHVLPPSNDSSSDNGYGSQENDSSQGNDGSGTGIESISHQEALPEFDAGITGDSALDVMVIICCVLACLICLFCIFLKCKAKAEVHVLEEDDGFMDESDDDAETGSDDEEKIMIDQSTSTTESARRQLPIIEMEMVDLSPDLDRADEISRQVMNRSPEHVTLDETLSSTLTSE